MAHFLQQQDGNTSLRKYVQTLAHSAQAIVHVRSDTRHDMWTWSCMVMMSSSLEMMTTSIGYHRNEKLELVQKARLGRGYDSEATVLNRRVTCSDAGLTWEADPRHAELAVAELGLQAARPQTSPGGAKPSAPLEHEELEPDGQKTYRSVSARLAYLASDRPDIAFACSRAVGKAARAIPCGSSRCNTKRASC